MLQRKISHISHLQHNFIIGFMGFYITGISDVLRTITNYHTEQTNMAATTQ
jgi:hypothetical protein